MNGPAEAAASSVIPQPGSGPMLRRLILAIGINAAALWAAAALVDGIQLSEQLDEVFVVATIFGLVNIFIKPVIKFFAFPVILITLGLFTLVINAGMLMLADRLASSPSGCRFHVRLPGRHHHLGGQHGDGIDSGPEREEEIGQPAATHHGVTG